MIMKTICSFLVAMLSLSLFAQNHPAAISLWPGTAPGSEGKQGPEKIRISDQGDHVISNINAPSITPYLPSLKNATGAAIIIAPGGGHKELWIDHEGYLPAQWLSDHGIAAFVLKYRLAKDTNSTYSVDRDELADIQRAIRTLRHRAKEWGIDTARIGVMGFSAGGELAALSAMRFDNGSQSPLDDIDKERSKPAFQALIYPGNSARYEVTKNSPPVFIACGFNDRPDISEGMARLYLQYKAVNVPADLHIYATTGHGFGLRSTNSGEMTDWIESFRKWLVDIKMLSK